MIMKKRDIHKNIQFYLCMFSIKQSKDRPKCAYLPGRKNKEGKKCIQKRYLHKKDKVICQREEINNIVY